MKKQYHRAHLRSPVNKSLFYTFGNSVRMGIIKNISAGGLCFRDDNIPSGEEDISFLTCVPQTPHLKNFSYDQIFDYNEALFPAVIIRAKGKIVRKFEEPSDPGGIYMGVQFSEIDSNDKVLVESFAEKAASNVSYLQAIIDSDQAEDKVYRVAEILGYSRDLAIRDLKSFLKRDLLSLKWN